MKQTNKPSWDDVKTSDYEIGLTKMVGKKVKEVHGYISIEFGEPTFKMTKIEFDDGSFVGCEGEHDFPYLVNYGQVNNLEEGVLEGINKTDPDYEEDEE